MAPPDRDQPSAAFPETALGLTQSSVGLSGFRPPPTLPSTPAPVVSTTAEAPGAEPVASHTMQVCTPACAEGAANRLVGNPKTFGSINNSNRDTHADPTWMVPYADILGADHAGIFDSELELTNSDAFSPTTLNAATDTYARDGAKDPCEPLQECSNHRSTHQIDRIPRACV